MAQHSPLAGNQSEHNAHNVLVTTLVTISKRSACRADGCRPTDEKYLSMRAEVEAPFRTFRLFILTFFAISAGLATLVATTQLIGAIGHAPAARPLDKTLQTFGIDVGAPLVGAAAAAL